jgi:aspartyl-tRNA(Asn)/glutamyl-tRNA(Gln) amidotransferase subunit A
VSVLFSGISRRPDRQECLSTRKMHISANWTIDGVRAALGAKKISARELAADFYKRIDSRNAELNAFLTLSPERARRQTDRIDALVAEGKPLPPLAGVPVAIKDVISTRGIKTTCGSKILENYFPPWEARMRTRLMGR